MDAILAWRRGRLEPGRYFEGGPRSAERMAVSAQLHMAVQSVEANLPEHA